MKKFLGLLLGALLLFGLGGCAMVDNADASLESEILGPDGEQTVMCAIRITVEDETLQGVLYDNPTARGLAEMLPLTVELWHPAPNFARAFNLPDQIEEKGAPGYEYELRSLAYWDAGPSIAVIYKASREKTVVPVVPVGKITSDVSVFEEYGGVITIEIEEDI